MGYYTKFELTYSRDLDKPEFKELTFDDLDYDQFSKVFYGITDYYVSIVEGEEEAIWCEHEEHMVSLSKLYSDILFRLEGHGEEPDDKWVMYFLNGKSQTCRAIITFEEYDNSKLV
jgi:hypothetical protein